MKRVVCTGTGQKEKNFFSSAFTSKEIMAFLTGVQIFQEKPA
jgi:hypothetical protein